jgi:hypothetical protein
LSADLAAAYSEALARHLPRAVAFLQSLPASAGVGLVAAGLLVLVAGARRRRPVAALGGFAAGALGGLALSGAATQARISGMSAVTAGAVAVGLLAALFPPVFPLALGAVLGGAVGAQLPLGPPAAGAVIGALVLAGAAVAGARPLAAGLAGLCGAALAVAGALALGPAIPGAGLVARHPLVGVAVVVVLGIAGGAGQLESAWDGAAKGRGKSSGNRRARLEPPRERSFEDD